MRLDLKQCVMATILPCVVWCAEPLAQSESDLNDLLCHTIGGARETTHHFTYGDGQQGRVSVGCETEFFVIEGGLDKRSSLDSLQQALFFSVLTSKSPAVVIYDTDERIGKYEHRIQAASEAAGVLFLRLCPDDAMDRERLETVFGR